MSESIMKRTVVDFSKAPSIRDEDRTRLDAMTDADITHAAQGDPDNPILNDEELATFKPVADVKAIRKSLHLTQEAFAREYDIPLGTLRDWEQHRTEPDKAAQNLLKVISVAPDVVKEALASS